MVKPNMNEDYEKLLNEPESEVSKFYSPTGKEIMYEDPSSTDAKPPLTGKSIFDASPKKIIDLSTMKKFRIVSENGTSDTTKIFYGDDEVQGVTQATISIDAETNLVLGTFTVLSPICNIEVPRNHVRIIEDENFPDFTHLKEFISTCVKTHEPDSVPTEDINKDGAT